MDPKTFGSLKYKKICYHIANQHLGLSKTKFKKSFGMA